MIHPPEWWPQSKLFLAWPAFEPEVWFGQLEEVYKEMSAFLHAVKDVVDLHLFVPKAFPGDPRIPSPVSLHEASYDDVWLRDSGAIQVFTQKGEPLALTFRFNAWGEKYPHTLDQKMGQIMAQKAKLPQKAYDLVLEGGALDTNGPLALTTKQCLLEQKRNPTLNQNDLDLFLRKTFGYQDICWLAGGLPGDHTDGHIDTIARFCNPNQIVYVQGDFPYLQQNEPILQDFATKHHLTLTPLPLPERTQHLPDGSPLPKTYANFVICNQKVLVPQYQDPNDKAALQILTKVFPTHEVIGLSSRAIIYGGGSFHCLTQPIFLEVSCEF